MAMAMYPEAQEKAQAELDKVVGTDRLPDFGDREDLIYLKALIIEIMRWHQVTPLGTLDIGLCQILWSIWYPRFAAETNGRRLLRWVFHSEGDDRHWQYLVRSGSTFFSTNVV
jgi:hypothetical protein